MIVETARTTPAYARESENFLQERYAVLLEFYRATVAMNNTFGHPEATAADEKRAEERFDAALANARRVIG